MIRALAHEGCHYKYSSNQSLFFLPSAPDKCDDGFSFEMTLKTNKDTFLKSDDMRYIVDSGASTFNSKGFSLYTLQGKLRADIAIPNDSLCLETPLETDRWHDVLVTWRKDKGKSLINNIGSHLGGHEQ